MRQMIKFKRSILKHYAKADLNDLHTGLNWYLNAHKFALEVAKVTQVPIIKVIGVMAALSPNNKWAQNKKDTMKFLCYPSLDTKVCTFPNQRDKALQIFMLNTGTPLQVELILNGIKTRNFFRNILEPNASTRVTVDIWAFRSVDVEPKTKYIKDITEAYQLAAKELDLQPLQLQAVVWGVVRGSHA